uniref:Uncharacterized protein n=1 Tax=Lactuca sativa TaxID=4236 RepID=A0A9R1X8U0_LACSA|nr:hypothetical protein LSAT_V11C500257840 [Lactuca sativa]
MLQSVRGSGFVLRKKQRYTSDETLECTKKLKWVDVNKIFDMTKEGRRPRHSMTPKYVYGEPHSVPSPVRNHFRRQDEYLCSVSSSDLSHGRGGRSEKPSLKHLVKRLLNSNNRCIGTENAPRY